MKSSSHIGKLWAIGLALLWLSACGHQAVPFRTHDPPYRLAQIEANRLATFRIDIHPAGHGSGVLISPHGHLATAYHVVDGAKGLSITMVESNGRLKTYQAKVMAVDKSHDLAIIKIERRFAQVPQLELANRTQPGDAIYNVGYPHDLGELVSRGNVMRLHWSYRFRSGSRVDRCMLVDIKNGPGTSGSAVFSSANGKIVGILVMKVWVKSTRAPATVVHVVVPTNYLRALMRQIRPNRLPPPTRPPVPSRPPLMKPSAPPTPK